jgi:hypothetical protein
MGMLSEVVGGPETCKVSTFSVDVGIHQEIAAVEDALGMNTIIKRTFQPQPAASYWQLGLVAALTCCWGKSPLHTTNDAAKVTDGSGGSRGAKICGAGGTSTGGSGGKRTGTMIFTEVPTVHDDVQVPHLGAAHTDRTASASAGFASRSE